jgi:GMP synthase-like glutamine amidotransferase
MMFSPTNLFTLTIVYVSPFSPFPFIPKRGFLLFCYAISLRITWEWHEDCFMLPTDAVSLAHQTNGFNQAFRYGQHAYGLQYHVELTEDMLDTWLHDPSLKKEFIETYGSETYRKVEQEAVELFPRYAQHSSIMLKNFFRLSGLIF